MGTLLKKEIVNMNKIRNRSDKSTCVSKMDFLVLKSRHILWQNNGSEAHIDIFLYSTNSDINNNADNDHHHYYYSLCPFPRANRSSAGADQKSLGSTAGEGKNMSSGA